MKKRLNTDVIGNELRGGSAFFPGYTGGDSPTSPAERTENAAPPDSLTAAAPVSSPPKPGQAVPERVNAPTVERPNGKRIITRNSFEIFEDQMGSLRKLSYEEKMEGLPGSMSGMVRDAIDDYLLKRSSG